MAQKRLMQELQALQKEKWVNIEVWPTPKQNRHPKRTRG